MDAGWHRFWAMDAWRAWLDHRRKWTTYSRTIRDMRKRLVSLAHRARDAEADRTLADRNLAWVSALRPRELPIELDPGELGLGTIDGVELLESRVRRRSTAWIAVDRGVVHVTDRRLVFSGSELVSVPLADVTDDSVGRRGWRLTVRNRSPIMLAGPVEQLVVVVDAVIEGLGWGDPRLRWMELRDDADQRLAVVELDRARMREMYSGLGRPIRPVSPGWVPAGALAMVLVVVGFLGSVQPPPPTVMSLQLTTTSTGIVEATIDSFPDVTEAASTAVAGSTTTPACHTSYTGRCVPVDVVDVDCAGGTDDGPYYVGEVVVVGPDVYGLDRDGDGTACDH